MNNVDLFATPIRSGKVRKDVWYHQYPNGVININGHKFIDYPIKWAVHIWRKQNPIKK